jgi:muramoyltetrapeptide carboxypeptidase
MIDIERFFVVRWSMREAGASADQPTLLGPRLRPGDRVRVVSPASTPERDVVALGVELLRSWGLVVELGGHVFDQLGHYSAGTDGDRLADLNDAFRDPGVRAVLTTRGGKGSYRIANAIDFDAARRDPKPLVGFSDITFLHQALYRHCRLATLHGPHIGWSEQYMGLFPAGSLRRTMMTTEPVILRQQPGEASAPLTTGGRATGRLLGGNLRGVGQSVGWGPSYDGAILALEAIDLMPGEIDGTLTQLLNSGVLEGVRGVAVGQFVRWAAPAPGKWSFLDILDDRLGTLGVPVLGGLPFGHGPVACTVPLGTIAALDAEAGTLTVEPAVC